MDEDRVSIDDVQIEFIPEEEREKQDHAYRVTYTMTPSWNVTRSELRRFTYQLVGLLLRREGEDR